MLTKKEEAEVKVKPPVVLVTLKEHLSAGFIKLDESEEAQKKEGKKVVEIKNVEGQVLHRLE